MDDSEGVNRITELDAALRTRLDTVGGGKFKDPSREDLSVMGLMLAAGLTPADVCATFMQSKRGLDVPRRHDPADYIPRTMRKALSKSDFEVNITNGKANGKADWYSEDAAPVDEGWEFKSFSDAMESGTYVIPYVVEDLVVEQAPTVTSAQPRSVKSASWLLAMMQGACGRNVWGHFQVEEPMPVAFIETEDPKFLVEQRIKSFAEGMRLTARDRENMKKNFHWACLGPFALAESEEKITAFLRKVKPRVAVLSTLQGLLNGRNWKEQSDMGPVMSVIVRVSRNVCPLVVITHSGWSGTKRSAGTVTQEANYVVSLHFQKKREDGKQKVIVHVDSKLGDVHPFVLTLDVKNTRLTGIHHRVIKKSDMIDTDMSTKDAVEASGASDRWVRKLKQKKRAKNSSGRRNNKRATNDEEAELIE